MKEKNRIIKIKYVPVIKKAYAIVCWAKSLNPATLVVGSLRHEMTQLKVELRNSRLKEERFIRFVPYNHLMCPKEVMHNFLKSSLNDYKEFLRKENIELLSKELKANAEELKIFEKYVDNNNAAYLLINMYYLNRINGFEFIEVYKYLPSFNTNKGNGFGFFVMKTNKKFNYCFKRAKKFNKVFIFKHAHFENSIQKFSHHVDNTGVHSVSISQCEI